MYNMMTGGPHPLAGMWMHVLGVDLRQCNRLRHAYVVFDRNTPRIYVLTRSSNNPVLREHPKLVISGPCEVDSTYHEYEFEMPSQFMEEVSGLEQLIGLPRFSEHFDQMMAALQDGDESDQVTKGIIERVRPLLEALSEKIEAGESGAFYI